MNKEFIACLEHIIDLEKTRMAQEDLLLAMNDRMNQLGQRTQYQAPPDYKKIKRPTEWSVRESHFTKSLAIVGAVIGFFLTFCIACAAMSTGTAFIVGLVGAGIIAIIMVPIGESMDKTAAKEAVQR